MLSSFFCALSLNNANILFIIIKECLIFLNLSPTFSLEKSKQKTRASHPKMGDLNFLNAEEKTPSPTARCRLADSHSISFRSHDLTTVKEFGLAVLSQIQFSARHSTVFRSRGKLNFP